MEKLVVLKFNVVKAAIALANGKIYLLLRLKNWKTVVCYHSCTHFVFDEKITNLSPLSPAIDEVGLVVASGNNLSLFDTFPANAKNENNVIDEPTVEEKDDLGISDENSRDNGHSRG